MIPAEHAINKCIDELASLPVHQSKRLQEVVNLLETARELLTAYIESEEFREPTTVLLGERYLSTLEPPKVGG